MPCESHSADGGPEEFGPLVGPAVDQLTGGQPHAETGDVIAEAARFVVVLAVDIGGYHAAERDELGAGRDGCEPAAGHEEAVDLMECETGLAGEQARLLIKA